MVGTAAVATQTRARTLPVVLDEIEDALAEIANCIGWRALLRARLARDELIVELAKAPGQPRPLADLRREVARAKVDLLTSETVYLVGEYGAKLRRLYAEIALAKGMRDKAKQILLL